MKQFEILLEKYIDKLDTYVPVVSRVHGPTHPEFYEVEKEYNLLSKNIDDNKDLDSNFISLKMITQNYHVPSDTCETYEAVYHMLHELDKAYYQ